MENFGENLNEEYKQIFKLNPISEILYKYFPEFKDKLPSELKEEKSNNHNGAV